MVMDTEAGPPADRGQLILIGAIALAFILLGVVVVFNGVQYTQTISSGSATQDTSDVAVVENELEGGIEELLETYPDASNDELEENVSAFLDQYVESKERQSPVSVHVESDVDDDEIILWMWYDSSAVNLEERELVIDR